jgi:hypothetical protein
MNHWQVFIVSATLVYFVIGAGFYAFFTVKAKPYVHLLPPQVTFRFVQLVFLFTAFGWPLLLQVAIYFKFIDVMAKLAKIEWKELIDLEALNLQMKTGEMTAEKILDDIDAVAVAMTRAPLEDEIGRVDRSELMRILYAIANDRAVACRALDELRECITSQLPQDTPTITYTPTMQKHCERARAIVDAWLDLVK